MSSELVSIGSREIKIDYEDALSIEAKRELKPKLIKQTKHFVQTGADIVKVSVLIVEETRVQVSYILEKGKRFRQISIPTIAKAKAYQNGRDYINSMGLDSDILAAAQEELDEKFKNT